MVPGKCSANMRPVMLPQRGQNQALVLRSIRVCPLPVLGTREMGQSEGGRLQVGFAFMIQF